jgi:hypothetical protein
MYIPIEGAAEHQRWNRLDKDDFVNGSTQKLGELAAAFKSDIVPNLRKAHWEVHPAGFYKARLRELLRNLELWRPEDDELGDPRLHTYLYGDSPVPTNMQQSLGPLFDGVRTGHIHTHDWFVAGRPLETVWPEETYRDVIFDIEPVLGTDISDEVVAQEGLLRVFSINYDSHVLTTDGSCVSVGINERRLIPQGQVHTIDPAVAHAVTIHDEVQASPGDDRFVSTLVISGHLVAGKGPYTYFVGSTSPMSGERRTVLPQKVERIQAGFEQFVVA